MRLAGHRLFMLTYPVAALAFVAGCGSGTTATAPDVTQVTDTAPDVTEAGPAQPSSAVAASENLVLTRDDDYTSTRSGVTLSIVCNGGGDITIDADDVQLQVVGDCEDIDIDGAANNVVAENADELEVEGSGNIVAANIVRSVEVDGDSNTVRLQSATEIEVEGSSNTVTYASGQPSIENEGDNVIGAG